jgi:hypothetical protein
MAASLSAWVVSATTLGATPGTATRFDLPAVVKRVRLSCASACQYSFAGTDGVALGVNAISVPTSAMPHTIEIAGQPSIYISSTGVSSSVQLLAMD